jgi:phosphate starvation-inducible membrane PsiE
MNITNYKDDDYVNVSGFLLFLFLYFQIAVLLSTLLSNNHSALFHFVY